MLSCRAKRSDAISAAVDAAIRKFFEDNASNSTRKRDGNYGRRKGKEGTPKKLLNGSVIELYRQWCNQRSIKKLPTVSHSAFASRRPEHVKIRSRNDRIECACQKDVNFRLLLEALCKFRQKHTKAGLVFTSQLSSHTSDLIAECTCIPTEDGSNEESDFLDTDIKCIMGTCGNCGTSCLDQHALVSIISHLHVDISENML